MPCDVKHVPDTNTVEVIGYGKLTSQEAVRATEEASRLLNENGATRVLCDYCDAVTEVTTVDIHWLPQYQEKLGAPKNIRIGLVLPKTGYRIEDFQFYETVCRNRGYNCRAFGSREAAAKWLDQGDTA